MTPIISEVISIPVHELKGDIKDYIINQKKSNSCGKPSRASKEGKILNIMSDSFCIQRYLQRQPLTFRTKADDFVVTK